MGQLASNIVLALGALAEQCGDEALSLHLRQAIIMATAAEQAQNPVPVSTANATTHGAGEGGPRPGTSVTPPAAESTGRPVVDWQAAGAAPAEAASMGISRGEYDYMHSPDGVSAPSSPATPPLPEG